MTFLHKKQVAIDLETLNINANYLVQVLRQVNTAKDEEITSDLKKACTQLFDDTSANISALRSAFVPEKIVTVTSTQASTKAS